MKIWSECKEAKHHAKAFFIWSEAALSQYKYTPALISKGMHTCDRLLLQDATFCLDATIVFAKGVPVSVSR